MYIPPGYKLIKEYPKSKKILAKCEDKKGRLQYIYHVDYINKQKKIKYCELIKFINKIDEIKKELKKDIKSKDIKTQMIATILTISLKCGLRIGNDKYEKLYNSTGLTTLKSSNIRGNKISFIGKKGVYNECIVDDNTKKILKKLSKYDNSQKYVFSYRTERGKSKIRADDVNKYLLKFGDFTTKYFRTYNANMKFIQNMNNITFKTEKERKIQIKEGLIKTAKSLNHTPAICKKSYISDKVYDYIMNKEIKVKSPEKLYKKIIGSCYKN
jgi:DNA topoisomerase-1